MSFKLYSTESGKAEVFEPNCPDEVRMYICGPTVYNVIHIGHARSYTTFDLLRRWLEFSGYEVQHVQNFSDVEESISRRAKKLGISPTETAEKYIEEFFVDADNLHMKRAHDYPTYSESVPKAIEVIQDLLESGVAYESDGDVFFRSNGGEKFGRLSHVDPEDVVADGLGPLEGRENPFDFVIWRKEEEGQLSWDSPWGKGRPGWHIGCYVMSSSSLGDCFDIHGGGIDLIFPHHESILLVSEAHTRMPVCNHFIHNSFVTLGRKKMSKSVGNFVTVRELTDKYGGGAIRYYLLKHHYRTILDFDESELEASSGEYRQLEGKARRLKEGAGDAGSGLEDVPGKVQEATAGLTEAMDDDMHTDRALVSLLKFINWALDEMDKFSKEDAEQVHQVVDQFDRVLGLF
jgi:cysteinyl-tRNA synthetase